MDKKTEIKVREVLTGLSGIGDFPEDAELQRDLGFDSILLVTLLLMLEETFGITLEEADMNPFDLVTVRQVVALAEKYTSEKTP